MQRVLAGILIVGAAGAAAFFGLSGTDDPEVPSEPAAAVSEQAAAPEQAAEAPAEVAAAPVTTEPEAVAALDAPAQASEEPAPAREVATDEMAPKPEETTASTAVASELDAGTAEAGSQTAAAEVQPTEPAPAEEETVIARAEPSQAEAAAETDETERLPRFDVVRVDSDGQTVIAGRATPNERVEILLDGGVVGEAMTDASGRFVAIIAAELDGAARQLQLRTTLAEGAQHKDRVAVAEPAPAAEAEPLTDPAPAPAVDATSEPAPEASVETTVEAAEEPVTTELARATPVEAPTDPTPPPSETPNETSASQAPVAEEIEPRAGRLAPSSSRLTPEADSSPTTSRPLSGGTATGTARVQAQPTPEAPAGSSVPEPAYAVSAPVIILPSPTGDAAPALVQPQEDRVALLQPQGAASSVTLDAIRYGDTGAVRLNGRGAPGNSVRIYGNGENLGDTGIEDNGTWAWALARERALGIRLFRFDELSPAGRVASRIETPFRYEATSPKIVREREVVIERGDMLWRIAEQYYGDGIRYSLIYGANTDLIRDPDLIYPGQVFTIPELVDAE